jgi:hypothetical protein
VAAKTTWILLLGLANCTRAQPSAKTEWVPKPAPDLGRVVANVGGAPIFAKQVLAESEMGGTTPRQALARLIENSVAAQAIHSVGRLPPSSDDEEVRAALVQRLLERELEPSLQQKDMSDAALRPLYDRARDNFVHPRLVDVGMLTIYTGPLMKDEPRKERRETASELAAWLANHPAESVEKFAKLAQDPGWAKRGVGYRRLLQGPDEPFSKIIGDEVIKLRAPGENTPLMADETGFYIARYIDEKPAQNVSFEQAREQLAAAYFQRWSQEQFLAFSSKLLQSHKVEIHFDRLAPNEDGR